MEEKKFLTKQLIKNVIYIFSVFAILVLIFDILVLQRAKQVQYNEIDENLYSLAELTRTDKIIILNPRIIYIMKDYEGNIINAESMGRLYEDYTY